MRLVSGHDVALAQWAAARIPHVGAAGFGPCVALGVASDRKLHAVWVFHDWCYGVMQVSVAAASPLWAHRSIVHRLLEYPFEQLDARKIWTVTPHTADRTIRLNEKLGMRKEGTIRHHFADGVHAVVCGMTAREYLKEYGLRTPLRCAA